jgi:predicted amino acid-binding ACT domain protein
MGEKISRVSYCYVEVADKPGEGARVLAALQKEGVNLLSLTAFPTAKGKCQIDLVAAGGDLDAAAAKARLKLSKKKQAFYVTGEDRPGAAAEILQILANAKINVIATNANVGPGGFGMIIWVKQGDVEAAAKAFAG